MLFKKNALPPAAADKLRQLTNQKPAAWLAYSANPNLEGAPHDSWIVATTTHLGRLGGTNATPDRLWSWHLVDRANWDPATNQFGIAFADDTPNLVITITDETPVKFLTMLRERVDHSVVISETVALNMTQTVRVAVRRTDTDTLVTQTICDPGVDPNAAAVTRKIAPVIARLQDLSGAR